MIREILRPETEQLIINIPKEYIHKEVEILVFPLLNEEPMALVSETAQNLMEFRKLMERAKKSNINVPKEIDIDNLIDERHSCLSRMALR